MKRHLCLVVALLIPSLMVVPLSVSQAGEFSMSGLFSNNSPQSHDAHSLKTDVFADLGASLIGKHIQVTWSINASLAVAYVVVQKSDDHKDFRFIGGMNLNRSVSPSEAFDYIDLEIPAKTSTLYRLKLVLQNGTILYSHAVKVQHGLDIIAYPDPVSTTLTLSLPPQANHPFHIQIFDQLGHPVKTVDILPENARQVQIELGHIPHGLYIVLVKGGQQKWHKRILKL
ncbi:MAG: T9SS type A sorting domain-containing protein [Bacteroidota bacterium]